jgi:PDZ domain
LLSQNLRGVFNVSGDQRFIKVTKPTPTTGLALDRILLSTARRSAASGIAICKRAGTASVRLGSMVRLRAAMGAALLLSSLSFPVFASQSTDSDPVLKMDVPKLDQLPQRKTLKGGVFHHEALAPKVNKLQTGTSNLNASVKAQSQESKLKTQAPKKGILSMFKGRAAREKQHEPFNLVVPDGVGIIGVKFVLGFGLPPTINRVFPGTPAHSAGLREKDIIVAVDGVPTSGLTKEEVYQMIVGLPDTPVTVSVLRNGDFLAKTMNRMDFNDIPDPEVKHDYLQSI